MPTIFSVVLTYVEGHCRKVEAHIRISVSLRFQIVSGVTDTNSVVFRSEGRKTWLTSVSASLPLRRHLSASTHQRQTSHKCKHDRPPECYASFAVADNIEVHVLCRFPHRIILHRGNFSYYTVMRLSETLLRRFSTVSQTLPACHSSSWKVRRQAFVTLSTRIVVYVIHSSWSILSLQRVSIINVVNEHNKVL